MNNNELCIAGEITDIIVDKPRIKKFILKAKGFEVLCTVLHKSGIPLNSITAGMKCYVQGTCEANRWTSPKGQSIIENQFTVNKIA